MEIADFSIGVNLVKTSGAFSGSMSLSSVSRDLPPLHFLVSESAFSHCSSHSQTRESAAKRKWKSLPAVIMLSLQIPSLSSCFVVFLFFSVVLPPSWCMLSPLRGLFPLLPPAVVFFVFFSAELPYIRLIHESAISRGCLVVGPILGSGM